MTKLNKTELKQFIRVADYIKCWQYECILKRRSSGLWRRVMLTLSEPGGSQLETSPPWKPQNSK